MGAALSACVRFVIGLYHAMPEFHEEKRNFGRIRDIV